MNYRHHFHAGNFADLIKHAALLAVLADLTKAGRPVTLIDTHAGAGLYDLTGEMALKSGEAAAGVGRLMAQADSPAAFDPLKAAVRRANPAGGLRFYPGSPALAAAALRGGDRLIACELRDQDAEALRRALKPAKPSIEVIVADGFATAPARVPVREPCMVLIDPPFERADDYAQIVRCLDAILARNPQAVVMVWTPLKDLETFDRLLRGMEDAGAPATLVVEARLRPLNDPMRMNGCALTVTHAPASLEAPISQICDWVVSALGEPGGEARIWWL